MFSPMMDVDYHVTIMYNLEGGEGRILEILTSVEVSIHSTYLLFIVCTSPKIQGAVALKTLFLTCYRAGIL